MTTHPELPGIPKKIGRPKTSNLSREEQVAAAGRRWREKQRKSFGPRRTLSIPWSIEAFVSDYAKHKGIDRNDAFQEILIKGVDACDWKPSWCASSMKSHMELTKKGKRLI